MLIAFGCAVLFAALYALAMYSTAGPAALGAVAVTLAVALVAVLHGQTLRDAADLEAIRRVLRADKLILVGRSWGGSLTARYLAAHPRHVAKAVFVSPGALREGAYPAHALVPDDEADPRPALRSAKVPALILRGECDYLKPEVAEDYRRTLPGSTLVAVAGAGHSITTEQPEYLPLLRDFLLS
ncbi:pimeloyl-ACP methyl ester carboxylesterase [Streptosporangium album]|uniref:Pimeloyl-ACP methyl ester carboxylesterase n=1 Tax=Streptosporangium album TaxID=47479 RepID=A0A7W7RRW8_9ACTN|nr:alpha/beta hydrolase [Streptosporangium album]MBB4936742.1 pimeloyl-ACP methyl ester carboxylesterase [Streptosporangium album]